MVGFGKGGKRAAPARAGGDLTPPPERRARAEARERERERKEEAEADGK